jgi:large subunit ribosomal protein L46
MDSAAGVDMNTWIVGRVPVAHVVTQPMFNEDSSIKQRGEKTFFLKGRIMAGQANLTGNPMGYKDFNWLTKEELKEKLPFPYFRGVRNMMADR